MYLIISLVAPMAYGNIIKYDNLEINFFLKKDILEKTVNFGFESSNINSFKTKNGDFVKVRTVLLEKEQDVNYRRIFKEKINILRSMLKVSPDPYTGAISNESNCVNSDLKPQIEEQKQFASATFYLKATDNFIYGNCSVSELTYFSKNVILICKKNKKLFDVRIYSKNRNSLNNFSVRCLP